MAHEQARLYDYFKEQARLHKYQSEGQSRGEGLFYSRPQSKNGSKSRNSATRTKIESAEREQSSVCGELVSPRVFSVEKAYKTETKEIMLLTQYLMYWTVTCTLIKRIPPPATYWNIYWVYNGFITITNGLITITFFFISATIVDWVLYSENAAIHLLPIHSFIRSFIHLDNCSIVTHRLPDAIVFT